MSLDNQRKTMAGSCGGAVLFQEQKTAIESAARAVLRQSPYHEIRGVTCEFHEGVLTLRGHVSSYYSKQIAQTLVYRMAGVEEVNNRLKVVSPPAHP